MSSYSYYIFYKPFNVLSQFSAELPDQITLKDFLKVEKDVYPVGRLDKDSEGLIILTNDPSLNHKLLDPNKGHKRTYLVQLDDDITEEAIRKASQGVDIKLKSGYYRTQPCIINKLLIIPILAERTPPVRFRSNIPTSWATITLTEGKNRQVRKTFAAVGFPVLRLIRKNIEDLQLDNLQPGEYRKMDKEELFKLLKLK